MGNNMANIRGIEYAFSSSISRKKLKKGKLCNRFRCLPFGVLFLQGFLFFHSHTDRDETKIKMKQEKIARDIVRWCFRCLLKPYHMQYNEYCVCHEYRMLCWIRVILCVCSRSLFLYLSSCSYLSFWVHKEPFITLKCFNIYGNFCQKQTT